MKVEEQDTPAVIKAFKESILELSKPNKTEPIDVENNGFLFKFMFDRATAMKLWVDGEVWKRNLPPGERIRIGLKPLGDKENTAKLQEYLAKYRITTDEERIGDIIRTLLNMNLLRALFNSKTYRQTYYDKAYESLADGYIGKADKDYSDLLTEIYEDDPALNEIFVRLVGDQEGVAITSAKQLQKLTGINMLKWDELNEKDAKAEARSQMEHTFTQAMKYRYALELETILSGGGKYGDLLQTDPAKYYLTDSDKGDVIQEAIYNAFELGDTIATYSVKDIAEIIGAPYSVVLGSSQRHKEVND